MAIYEEDVVWIPYDKHGNLDMERLFLQKEIYTENGWAVGIWDPDNPKQSDSKFLPHNFTAGGQLETLQSTAIAVTHGSPGCITFKWLGVEVTFCWPQK